MKNQSIILMKNVSLLSLLIFCTMLLVSCHKKETPKSSLNTEFTVNDQVEIPDSTEKIILLIKDKKVVGYEIVTTGGLPAKPLMMAKIIRDISQNSCYECDSSYRPDKPGSGSCVQLECCKVDGIACKLTKLVSLTQPVVEESGDSTYVIGIDFGYNYKH